ncbi:methylated-DNA--[protein]-cysteine S-methyltransferase [Pseudoalteromonas piscicida]|uniref:Methylated-DNA--protein-cysteine methyltransferase n=1 Tax=Pseudoalteromonas piscicida TaxID=43662 RepID=A0AAD0RM71_PSEO7|nr:methylated-DNA--[protein]-cysteine S-methyltransferase [Pseudoalteromonas piscicida]ASD68999.1 cysteine methyltransferase [Pseudoalteromonas piscicida]AXR00517.1 methylated-DNA--[protein]-cysteine S-methyltransferase [Pseudoalteromonas piscicida]AXR04629.1 methylated-DNA--[protein]-cysteine S-methyltransferase [Pseudoalteromonas piscicida]
MIETTLVSPTGEWIIQASNDGLRYVGFFPNTRYEQGENQHTETAKKQLNEYFAGKRKRFDVALDVDGTHFQKQVWRILAQVPFGETYTYGWIAERLGNKNAVRAVGAANGKNPISIIVPCHRIIGANGKLTGYAGGLEAKAWLLQHEGVSFKK